MDDSRGLSFMVRAVAFEELIFLPIPPVDEALSRDGHERLEEVGVLPRRAGVEAVAGQGQGGAHEVAIGAGSYLQRMDGMMLLAITT